MVKDTAEHIEYMYRLTQSADPPPEGFLSKYINLDMISSIAGVHFILEEKYMNLIASL